MYSTNLDGSDVQVVLPTSTLGLGNLGDVPGLTLVGSTLYGVTPEGGANRRGSVFSVNPDGSIAGGGTPSVVERVMIRPPTGRIGPVTPEERKAIMNASPVKGKYDTAIDAESAYEMIQKRIAGMAATANEAGGTAAGGGGGILGQIGSIAGTIFGTNVPRGRMSTGQIIARQVTRSVTNKVIGGLAADVGKSVGGSLGGSIGRSLVPLALTRIEPR